jgi:hypothetical protein
MAGGNPTDERRERDFYPTPYEVPWALVKAQRFGRTIHECASGDDAIVKFLEKVGYNVIATDIHPLGRGEKMDFFDIKKPLADCIITNPPFDIAADFIEHAWQVLKVRKMALVLKATYWHAKTRRGLYERCKPAAIHPLTWRPDFLNKGAPTMDVMWCYWDRAYTGVDPVYQPLDKPTKSSKLLL